MTQKHNDTAQLRQNIITGEWVIVATARARRPEEFAEHDDDVATQTAHDPFADPVASGQEEDVLIYRDSTGAWTTRVFPNKYPALTPMANVAVLDEGPHVAVSGVGAHELVVTRDAARPFALLEPVALAEVIDAFQDRYLAHMRSRLVRYVSMFYNHGARAGASIRHPHAQIMALPVVPRAVQAEVDAVDRYTRQNGTSPFHVMLSHELTARKRIVAENDDFVILCPFASHANFAMQILPKEPQPYFERLTNAKKVAFAEVLGAALRALHRGLNDPAVNMFIHTAPCDGRDYRGYVWYAEIVPRLTKIAGFELATSMEIITVTPEDAAVFLRAQI